VRRPVVWLPEADADLKEALAWSGSIAPELGQRFAEQGRGLCRHVIFAGHGAAEALQPLSA